MQLLVRMLADIVLVNLLTNPMSRHNHQVMNSLPKTTWSSIQFLMLAKEPRARQSSFKSTSDCLDSHVLVNQVLLVTHRLAKEPRARQSSFKSTSDCLDSSHVLVNQVLLDTYRLAKEPRARQSSFKSTSGQSSFASHI